MQHAHGAPCTLRVALLHLLFLSPSSCSTIISNTASIIRRHVTSQQPDAVVDAPPSKIEYDLGKGIVSDTLDYAWQVSGEATEARAASSQLRASIASQQASAVAMATSEQSLSNKNIVADVTAWEKKASAALAQALQSEEKAKALSAAKTEEAYEAARKAAEKEIAALEKEADAYYQSLLDKLAMLGKPTKDARADAMAKAAEPYIKVQLRVADLVLNYNTKATETAIAAQTMVNQAFVLARDANFEQANGNAEMAQRKMIMAHQLVVQANMQEATAKNVRKLAASLNASIPSYQKAAEMAAIHVFATFSGLQTGKRGSHENTQVGEVLQQVRKSDHEATAALASLATLLARASREL